MPSILVQFLAHPAWLHVADRNIIVRVEVVNLRMFPPDIIVPGAVLLLIQTMRTQMRVTLITGLLSWSAQRDITVCLALNMIVLQDTTAKKRASHQSHAAACAKLATTVPMPQLRLMPKRADQLHIIVQRAPLSRLKLRQVTTQAH